MAEPNFQSFLFAIQLTVKGKSMRLQEALNVSDDFFPIDLLSGIGMSLALDESPGSSRVSLRVQAAVCAYGGAKVNYFE